MFLEDRGLKALEDYKDFKVCPELQALFPDPMAILVFRARRDGKVLKGFPAQPGVQGYKDFRALKGLAAHLAYQEYRGDQELQALKGLPEVQGKALSGVAHG